MALCLDSAAFAASYFSYAEPGGRLVCAFRQHLFTTVLLSLKVVVRDYLVVICRVAAAWG